MHKVMVCPVREGVILVTVPIVLNGDLLQCVFITRNGELARVGIFAGQLRDVGPFFILENYSRRTVPTASLIEAHKRAREALDEFEPQTDRMTSFAFVADTATAQAVCNGV
jgi:hypothetical protein